MKQVRALEAAFRMTKRGRTTVTSSVPPAGATPSVPIVQLVAEECTLKGGYIGQARDIPRAIAPDRDGRLAVDRLLSHRLALADIRERFDRLADGSAIRQIAAF